MNLDSLAPVPQGIADPLEQTAKAPFSSLERVGDLAVPQDIAPTPSLPRDPGDPGKPRSEEKRKEGEVSVGSMCQAAGTQRWFCPPCWGTFTSRSYSLLRNEPGPLTCVPNARFQESHLNTWYLRCKETASLYLGLC